MIKVGWILIRVILIHLHRKKISSPGDCARKQTQLIKPKATLDMRVTIHFSFHTSHSGPPFFKFDSERANVLSRKYLFNFGTTAHKFSVSCFDFGTSLYSVVAYLIKYDSSFGLLFSVNLVVYVAVLNSRFFSLILIWKNDGILSFKRPLNVIFKTISHFSDNTS